MGALYRWLLYLYPEQFRQRFAEEMCWVYAEASASASRAGIARQSLFVAREVCGMVRGAVQERAHRWFEEGFISRRFAMATIRSRFRFPIAGIGFMVACLGLILTAIRHAQALSYEFAKTTNYRPDHVSFVQTFGFAFGVTLFCVAVVCVILYATRRMGVQRLSELQTWPQP